MDANKYSVPNLPATQQVLEDISDPVIFKVHPLVLTADEEILQNAFSCHQYYKKLENDLQHQAGFSSELDELNNKLVENIDNMKGQIIGNENEN